jgi:hypothetical protein
VPIDPELAEYLAAVAAVVPPIASPTPHARRARMEEIARRFPFPADEGCAAGPLAAFAWP